jgi:hypothetical protein
VQLSGFAGKQNESVNAGCETCIRCHCFSILFCAPSAQARLKLTPENACVYGKEQKVCVFEQIGHA